MNTTKKAILSFLALFVCTATAAGSSICFVLGNNLENSETPKVTIETYSVEKTQTTVKYFVGRPFPKNFYLIEGSVSEETVNTFLATWNQIPISLQNSFINNGWCFVLTSHDLATRQGLEYGSVYGTTSHNEKRIYIQENSEDIVEQTVAHEIGHYLDSELQFEPRFSAEFEQIFQEERFKIDHVRGNYCIENIREYFAEAVGLVIRYPEDSKVSAPKTYNFVMQRLSLI